MSKRPLSRTNAKLTERQMQVAMLLAEGYSVSQIAKQLSVRQVVIESHIRAICDKWLLGSDVTYSKLVEIAKEKI